MDRVMGFDCRRWICTWSPSGVSVCSFLDALRPDFLQCLVYGYRARVIYRAPRLSLRSTLRCTNGTNGRLTSRFGIGILPNKTSPSSKQTSKDPAACAALKAFFVESFFTFLWELQMMSLVFAQNDLPMPFSTNLAGLPQDPSDIVTEAESLR